MMNFSFLDQIAKVVVEQFSGSLSELTIVLPNKRAKIFLIEALQKQIENNIFSPKIISIEDFVQEISAINPIDPIELLFEFYEVYLSITPKSSQQGFEQFANWAKMLLQDFNEIDRYLLDANHVLSYIKDIEDIKKWGIEVENKTKLLENYVDFWKLLPLYYQSFYSHLIKKKQGYQGLIYREAVRNIINFSSTRGNQQFLFAGFNALNSAEEQIIQTLIKNDQATIYWDADSVFMEDVHHDAALFLRKFKSGWNYYKNNPFEWIGNNFSQNKNIHIIGTPKSIGQTKIAGAIVESILDENPTSSLNDVAIVLGDENLLLPLLHGLPSSVNALNITMGFTSKNNPIQIVLSKLFKMHTNAITRKGEHYVFYYKEVLDLLNSPLIQPFIDADQLVKTMQVNNYSFISHSKLFELYVGKQSELFDLIFKKWDSDAVSVLQRISTILLFVKQKISQDTDEEKVTLAFIFSNFKVINKLISYFTKFQSVNQIPILFSVYKQVIDLAEVSFEGEPLRGLQIMGVLESRVLDFDTVIITSMNEGKFPAGKTMNSFIPYDVKRELGLPTYKEKDAVYTYHFYHLLQRAKTVYLLYNTDSSGMDGGEMSRFITQLEVEKQPNHTLTHEIYNAVLPDTASQPMVVEKSAALMVKLHEMAQKRFSPSSLISYIRNPIQFYFQSVLRIREADDVEENIALNTLGTIIHKVLEVLYLPFLGKIITEDDLLNALKSIDSEVLRQFKYIYKEGEINKGRNLLAFEVAKRNVANFIKMELESVRKGESIKIIALEAGLTSTLKHPNLPFEVVFGGNVDRIEERDGKIRIIDYKTGKVEKNSLVLKSWTGLTTEIKNDKIIQILMYVLMYKNTAGDLPIETGIVSFKNLKAGFLPFTFKGQNGAQSIVDKTILDDFIDQLVLLLAEIFDESIPFQEKKK